MSHFDVTLIAGPTASGKSAWAEEMAREKDSVIINADALQLYAGLPILTAQPSLKTQAAIPHALYGILAADHTTHAAEWVGLAVAAIRAAWRDGLHPVVVGGTGLYLKSLVSGLSPMPDIPDDVRAEARATQAEMGNPAFHEKLAQMDPVIAARLRPSDTQRLIRAYEVFVASGESLARWQEKPAVPPLPEAVFETWCIDRPRDELRARARQRLDQMVDLGVLDEVVAMDQDIAQGKVPTRAPVIRALGYHAFAAHVRGEMTLDAAKEAATTETCQYIKRQQTWFRHQMLFDHTIMIKE